MNGRKVGLWEYYDINGYVSYIDESVSHTMLNLVSAYSSGGGTHSNYASLWSECEELEDILNENNIDHEALSYPMNYHELEDLRDEYQSLLEENDIDY